MSTLIIDFLSTSTDASVNGASIIGHCIFFFCNFLNFLYLMLYEWYITGRWRRNMFSQLMTIAVVAQMISCVGSIMHHNMDDQYHQTLTWIASALSFTAVTPMNVCAVYLFFNINYKKYMPLGVMVALFVAFTGTFILFVQWDSMLTLPFKIFFFFSTLWQTAAIISALVAHKKGKLHGPVAHDVLTRQFTVSLVVHCTVIVCGLTGMPLFIYSGAGISWMNFVALGSSVGTMDFMPYVHSEEADLADIVEDKTLGIEDAGAQETENMTVFDASEIAQMEKDEIERVSKWKAALWPIRLHRVMQTEHGAIERQIVIAPEAFRMWFYFGFIIYTMIAISVSLTWSELKLDDNPIRNRFGNNNLCIFFDFPPFSHFATTLWLPQVFTLLAWEWFDHGRVYGDYLAKTISSKVYYAYTALTIFESLAICFFAQITATSPFENMYLHSMPWVIVTFALWTIAFKRFLYFEKEHVFNKDGGRRLYLGWIYIVLLAITVIIKNSCNIPNLFEAYLWKRDGLEWTTNLSALNDRVFLVLVLVCPMVIYFTFSEDMPTVKLAHYIPS